MSETLDKDRLQHAREQGQAQFDSIREMLDRAKMDDGNVCYDEVLEHPLSVEVRSGWYAPGQYGTGHDRTAEYRILLCTGGPAVQIVGELSEHGEPETAVMQVQDWFTPWTEFYPDMPDHRESAHDVMLEYARQFYFGE